MGQIFGKEELLREFCRVFPRRSRLLFNFCCRPLSNQATMLDRVVQVGMVGNLWRDPALVMPVNESALRGYDHLQNLHLLFAVGDRGFLAGTRRSDF